MPAPSPLADFERARAMDDARVRFERVRRLRAVAIGMLFVAAIGAFAFLLTLQPNRTRRNPPDPVLAAATAPRVSPSMDKASMLEVAPQEAAAINAAIPLLDAPNPAALSFSTALRGSDFERATQCLAAAIYYEAGNEPPGGERAVAQVVLNRVRHPAFPHSVCGVVFQGADRSTGCQFSFTCDGSLQRKPSAAGWARARRIAQAALAGSVYAPVGWATHYHADYVVPKWARTLGKIGMVGRHIFYRWSDGWGRPSAYRAAYTGGETLNLWNAAIAAAPEFSPAVPEVGSAVGPIDANAMRAPLREMPLTGDDGASAPLAPERWALRDGQAGTAAPVATPQPRATPTPIR